MVYLSRSLAQILYDAIARLQLLDAFVGDLVDVPCG